MQEQVSSRPCECSGRIGRNSIPKKEWERHGARSACVRAAVTSASVQWGVCACTLPLLFSLLPPSFPSLEKSKGGEQRGGELGCRSGEAETRGRRADAGAGTHVSESRLTLTRVCKRVIPRLLPTLRGLKTSQRKQFVTPRAHTNAHKRAHTHAHAPSPLFLCYRVPQGFCFWASDLVPRHPPWKGARVSSFLLAPFLRQTRSGARSTR